MPVCIVSISGNGKRAPFSSVQHAAACRRESEKHNFVSLQTKLLIMTQLSIYHTTKLSKWSTSFQLLVNLFLPAHSTIELDTMKLSTDYQCSTLHLHCCASFHFPVYRLFHILFGLLRIQRNNIRQNFHRLIHSFHCNTLSSPMEIKTTCTKIWAR